MKDQRPIPVQLVCLAAGSMSPLDLNGAGAADIVRLTARRTGKKKVRLIPV